MKTRKPAAGATGRALEMRNGTRHDDTTKTPAWHPVPSILIRVPRGERPRLLLCCRDGAEEAELNAVAERVASALGLTRGAAARRERRPRLAPWNRRR